MATPVRAGDAPGDTWSRGPAPWWPAALAAVAAAALLLPWWRADAGPVLLGGGPARLTPDSWTGFEVAGLRAALVVALAVAAAVFALLTADARTAARASAAAAGAAAVACGVAALLGWGPTGAPGAWLTLATGLAAAGAALVRGPGATRTPLVLVTALVAAAATVVVPGGEPVPDRTAAGPFLRVAALGPWPLRSGAGGLDSAVRDAVPVVVDGAPGVVGDSGVVVADARGRARVLARVGSGGPPPLGVAGGRVVRWITADSLAVTELHAGGPLDVVVRDVGAASPMGDDGSVWVRSDLDPPEAVRRLDLAAYDGRQDLSATYLPVVTIQNPDGEPPVDVHEVRPVPGGALRLNDAGDPRRLQLLTGTPAGIAVRTLLDTSTPACGDTTITTLGGLRIVAADATGVWFSTPDRRLAHRDADGTVRTVAARLPGLLAALAAPGDGSVLFVARDDDGDALWRLPDATAALGDPVTCGNG